MKLAIRILFVVVGLSFSWDTLANHTCRKKLAGASTSDTVRIGFDDVLSDTVTIHSPIPIAKETRLLGRTDFTFQVHIVPSTAERPKTPLLCFVPGGPGLSSSTMRELEILKRSHDLAFFDPPETGGQGPVPWENYATRDIYEYYLVSFLEAVEDLHRDVILIGHSHGGLLVADAAVLATTGRPTNIRGIVPMAAPLREEYFDNFRLLIRHSSESEIRFRQAHDEYFHSRTPESFSHWVSSLEPLIVSDEQKGRLAQVLEEDQPSANTLFFLRKQWPPPLTNIYDFLPRSLARIRSSIRSHFIVPADDKFFSPEEQIQDAITAKGSARIIQGSHFVYLENPDKVARTIENFSEKIYATPNSN